MHVRQQQPAIDDTKAPFLRNIVMDESFRPNLQVEVRPNTYIQFPYVKSLRVTLSGEKKTSSSMGVSINFRF